MLSSDAPHRPLSSIIKEHEIKHLINPQPTYNGPKPHVMNEIIFRDLRRFALTAVPECRKVVVGFEHFYFASTCRTVEVPADGDRELPLPTHTIALQVRFCMQNKFACIGTICYDMFTDRSQVANLLRLYIEDVFQCDLSVLATISSAKPEVLLLLHAMDVQISKANGGIVDLFNYKIYDRPRIVHIFDPSWMIRMLKGEFLHRDILLKTEKGVACASYEHVETLYRSDMITQIFANNDCGRSAYGTIPASKLFGRTIASLLEQSFQSTSDCSHEEVQGTKEVLNFFSDLYDTFYTQPDGQYLDISASRRYRNQVYVDSPHWKFWQDAVGVLEGMKFVDSPEELENHKDQRRAMRNQRERQHIRVNEEKYLQLTPLSIGPTVIEEAIGSERTKVIYNENSTRHFADDEYDEANKEYAFHERLDLYKAMYNVYASKKFEESGMPADILDSAGERLGIPNLLLSLRRARMLDAALIAAECVAFTQRDKVNQTDWDATNVLLASVRIMASQCRNLNGATRTFEYIAVEWNQRIGQFSHDDLQGPVYFKRFRQILEDMHKLFSLMLICPFRLWQSIIAGVNIFSTLLLTRHHFRVVSTAMLNNDPLHFYVNRIRMNNGFGEMALSNALYGDPLDYEKCIMAFHQSANVTIRMPIVDDPDEVHSLELLKQKLSEPRKDAQLLDEMNKLAVNAAARNSAEGDVGGVDIANADIPVEKEVKKDKKRKKKKNKSSIDSIIEEPTANEETDEKEVIVVDASVEKNQPKKRTKKKPTKKGDDNSGEELQAIEEESPKQPREEHPNVPNDQDDSVIDSAVEFLGNISLDETEP